MPEALLNLCLLTAGVVGAMILGNWLACRLTAERCPECGSRWQTQLTGEWDGEEDWSCLACGYSWAVPYGR